MATFKITRAGAPDDEMPRIVEAKMAKSAIAHVAATAFIAEVITMKDAMAFAKQGVELETAGEKTEAAA